MSNERQKSAVLHEIASSGFPLEIAAFRDLHEVGRIVSPNLHYNDEKGNTHELDAFGFVVHEDDPALGTFSSVALVECKQSLDKPWVFFRQEYDPLGTVSILDKVMLLSNLRTSDGSTLLRAVVNSPIMKHHYNDESIPAARTYFEAFKQHRKDGDIYNAARGLWHARSFTRRWFERDLALRRGEVSTLLVHAVIVLEGALYLAQRTAEGEWDADLVNHLLLRTIDCVSSDTLSPFPENEVIIDVVTKNYFPRYLERFERDATAVFDHLLNRHKLRDLVFPADKPTE